MAVDDCCRSEKAWHDGFKDRRRDAGLGKVRETKEYIRGSPAKEGLVWLFLLIGGLFPGCPSNENPTTLSR